jgi:serine O-acetyltransferase
MIYRHVEEIVSRLLDSYKADEAPFLTDPTLKFRELDCDLEEARRLRELFFPNYWNCGWISLPENKTELEHRLNELSHLFFQGIRPYLDSDSETAVTVGQLLNQLPAIRETLKTDVAAAYRGDPAAQSYTEIVRAYPGLSVMQIQRVAHVLYELDVPVYPRELTEQIRITTGIDIHPGARIGESFFIDHGSGVVIGETSEIGDNVRLYQGVTLGALHFQKEGNMLKKGYKRHPTIGSSVVIGMGAAILGAVTIGNNVSIGANSWIQEDIPDDMTVFISEHPKLVFKRNGKDLKNDESK